MDFDQRKQAMRLNSVRVLPADQHGRQGITFDGQTYRNLDTLAVFDQMKLHYFDPLMEQVNTIQKTLLAMQGVNYRTATQALGAGQVENAPAQVWPGRVDLTGLFRDRRPSIHDLVIGVRPGPNGGGGLDTVRVSLHELMHTLTVGASGWGKSTWLRSLLWQVAKAREAIEIVAIDISGSEFNILREWGKLRYPVARTTGDAAATLGAVSAEIERRKDLYEQCPLATKLTEYNEATGADMPPWLVVVDEGTNLLNQPGIGEPLREAVQTARQYGVYILLAGQSAKHSVVDTQTRDQFSSRLCFRTSHTSSRVVLDDKAAGDLVAKGRMQAQLAGQELAELQGPFVTRQEFMAALTGGGPAQGTPVVGDVAQDERIRQLAAEGLSKREIEKLVFGYTGGTAHSEVRRVLGATIVAD